MAQNFVHLHTHTECSALDGIGRPADLAAAAAADGQPALAITDHGTLAGTIAMRDETKKRKIKPILGAEVSVAIGSRHERNAIEVDADSDDLTDFDEESAKKTTKSKKYEHLTVLARTATGWKNLVGMQNAAQDSYWYKPRIDLQLLAEHGEGLTVLTGCLGGPVAGALLRGDRDGAEAALKSICDSVGVENVFVEIMEHGLPVEAPVTLQLIDLAKRMGLPLVATNDVHYTKRDDARAQDAWLSNGTGAQLSNPHRFHFHGFGYHLRTAAEMAAVGAHLGDAWTQACENTLLIADSVDAKVMPEYRLRLPKFDVPDGLSADTYLMNLMAEGAREIYGDPLSGEVKARLRHEFNVITGKGLADYFLIVRDAINWARANGIRVGPGRGSASGSLASYCLGIVQVDPLSNGLIFERFLDPERVGMPDIDVDFDSAEGARVIAYLSERWGADRVARIGTLSKNLSRSSLKSAGRVLGKSDLGALLSKLVPVAMGKPEKFEKLLDPSNAGAADFRELANTSEAKEIVELASTLEGVSGRAGIHACGVLISDESMDDLVPFRIDRTKGGAGGRVTEWEAGPMEREGYLKLDVLKLRTLNIISNCVAQITATTGEVIDPDTIPTDSSDPRAAQTWAMLQAGHTAGVFQLEGSGITSLVEAVAPTELADLTAIAALYRPGPMGSNSHTAYADRKNGRERVSYDSLTTDKAEQKAIAAVLGETFGLAPFQESLMALGTHIAGFDPIWTSKLRKAVSKKIREDMQFVGTEFLAGAQEEILDADGTVIKMAFSKKTAANIWKVIESAGDYAFVKAHAAAYGWLGYITAYLKANWPAQYAAALLSVTDDADRRLATLADLAREEIVVLGPSVNTGTARTEAGVDGFVHLGTAEILGVGIAPAMAIEGERNLGGAFTSLHDLISRVQVPASDAEKDDRVLGVGTIEALIEAGALDDLGSRMALKIIARASRYASPEPLEASWGALDQGRRERAATGVCLTAHPLKVLSTRIKKYSDERGDRPVPVHMVPDKHRARVHVLGVVTQWSEGTYSKGRKIHFTLEGTRGQVSGTFWEDAVAAIRESKTRPRPGDIVAIHGRVSVREVVVAKFVDDGEGEPMEQEVTEIRHELTGDRIAGVPVPDMAIVEPPLLVRRVVLPVAVVVEEGEGLFDLDLAA